MAKGLGFLLFQEICKDKPEKNVWISPTSIDAALAMATMGASNASTTETELLEALAAENKNALAQRCEDEFNFASQFPMGGDSGVELAIANAIFASGAIKSTYIELLSSRFGADALPLTDHVAINSWVAGKTRDQITNLLDALDPLTKAVIVNAVYFKGAWEVAFEPDRTMRSNFKLLDGAMKSCAMMSSDNKELYHESEQFQAVLKPYKGGKIAALFALPREEGADALKATEQAVIEAFGSGVFADAFGENASKTKVILQVPRFKLKEKLSLKPTLQAVGVKQAFLDVNEFTDMSDIPSLFVSDVIHSTTLEVTEEGTVAAAATAVVMMTRSMPGRPPPHMRLDRPFYFAIVDVSRLNATIFVGRVIQPELMEMPEGVESFQSKGSKGKGKGKRGSSGYGGGGKTEKEEL